MNFQALGIIWHLGRKKIVVWGRVMSWPRYTTGERRSFFVCENVFHSHWTDLHWIKGTSSPENHGVFNIKLVRVSISAGSLSSVLTIHNPITITINHYRSPVNPNMIHKNFSFLIPLIQYHHLLLSQGFMMLHGFSERSFSSSWSSSIVPYIPGIVGTTAATAPATLWTLPPSRREDRNGRKDGRNFTIKTGIFWGNS